MRYPLFFLLAALPSIAAEDGPAFFESKVRPILAKRCLACHSATSQPVMGGLRLDDRDAAIKGGSRGPSLVPGKPAESLLLQAVRHEAGPLKMPPGPRMTDADTAILTEWIQRGAPWGATVSSAPVPQGPFWAFVPPKRPEPPAVRNPAWVRSPIDAFLLQALEAKGLKPAPPASKRELLRRASYDLTGLPPTPDEVSAFLADSSPDAFAKVIDRLLASPRYGERWARHWLDVARYADSNGLDENLVYKNAFRYRDYVIQALNKDKPFDRFLTEQLAGDLLPAADLNTQYEQWTATGFLSLGAKMLAEDDPVKMQMDIVDEQLDTAVRGFLGLTIGCARCHDHKFDPIPTADYYAMAGIFKSSKTMENYKVVAKWHEHVLAPPKDRERLAKHEELLEKMRKQAGRLTKKQNDALADDAVRRVEAYLLAARRVRETEQIQLAPVESAPDAIVREASSFDAGNVPRTLEQKKPNTPKDSKGPYFAEYVIQAPEAGDYQIDVLDQERGSGTADLYVNGVWMKRGADPVQNRAASPEAGGWSVVAVVPFNKGENRIRLEHAARFPYFAKLLAARHTGGAAPRTPVQIAAEFGINPGFLEGFVEWFKRSDGAVASPFYAFETLGTDAKPEAWTSPAAALFRDLSDRTPETIANHYGDLFRRAVKSKKKPSNPGLAVFHALRTEKFGPFRAPANVRRYYPASARAEIEKLEEETKALEAATPDFPRSMGVIDGDRPADIPIHIRGSHWTLGETVPRHFLSAIQGVEALSIPKGSSGRLELAKWMTQPNHPLTARVIANRMWRWHFGRGIVPSVDNFGRLGEAPVNQPLLDWLATEFVRQGWSLKQFHRTLMLSNAYAMSSQYNAAAAEVDPDNHLLWRMNRRRLEAESMRDAIMAVSGGLDTEHTGGSLLQYKDRQYVANTARGGNVDYERNIRAVYIPVVRSSLYDVFNAFDLPDPAVSNGDRDSTVVAPQALFMMNGAVLLRHSRQMAEGLLARTDLTDSDRIRLAYERALSRPATGNEVDGALTFITRMEKPWNGDRIRAWQSFCKALLASNEFLYIN